MSRTSGLPSGWGFFIRLSVFLLILGASIVAVGDSPFVYGASKAKRPSATGSKNPAARASMAQVEKVLKARLAASVSVLQVLDMKAQRAQQSVPPASGMLDAFRAWLALKTTKNAYAGGLYPKLDRAYSSQSRALIDTKSAHDDTLKYRKAADEKFRGASEELWRRGEKAQAGELDRFRREMASDMGEAARWLEEGLKAHAVALEGYYAATLGESVGGLQRLALAAAEPASCPRSQIDFHEGQIAQAKSRQDYWKSKLSADQASCGAGRVSATVCKQLVDGDNYWIETEQGTIDSHTREKESLLKQCEPKPKCTGGQVADAQGKCGCPSGQELKAGNCEPKGPVKPPDDCPKGPVAGSGFMLVNAAPCPKVDERTRLAQQRVDLKKLRESRETQFVLVGNQINPKLKSLGMRELDVREMDNAAKALNAAIKAKDQSCAGQAASAACKKWKTEGPKLKQQQVSIQTSTDSIAALQKKIQDNKPAAPAQKLTPAGSRMNDLGVESIKYHEKFHSKIYLDNGVPTIGYGHHLLEGESQKYRNGIDEKTASAILAKDVQRKEAELRKLLKPGVQFTPNQWASTVELYYSVIPGVFRNSQFLKDLNADTVDHVVDYADAHDQIRTFWSETVNGTRVLRPGLVRRRRDQMDLWDTP